MSTAETIRAYARERFRGTLFLPLGGLVYVAGCVATTMPRSVADAALGWATVMMLLLALRIADDLIDREADRVDHPGRVLSRVETAAPVAWLGVMALAATLGMLPTLGAVAMRATVVTGVLIGLAAWYALRRRWPPHPLLHAQMILLKYPAIAIAASPSPTLVGHGTGSLALVGLYLGLCAYEAFDDPRIRASLSR